MLNNEVIELDYYICSTSVFDNLHMENGDIIRNIPGGAGIYALAGAKLWAEEVRLVCGVGNDYRSKMTEWYETNKLSMDCLRHEEIDTPINDVYYDTEEEREEKPEFGLEHYKRFETKEEEFLHLVSKENTGIYVFRNTDDSFWGKFKKLEEKKAFILWEIAEDACKPSEIANIKKITEKIDVLSLNMEEAVKLFGINDYDEIIKSLLELNIPNVFLRQGKKGQTFIINEEVHFVPSIKSKLVVDVTGGGNSSSGAVLVGASKGYKPEELGDMANKSAIMCLSQLGIPVLIENKI